MEAALREIRIADLKTKIAACQQEYMELVRKSSAPDLTEEETATISHIKEETTKHGDYLRYMLGLYEYQGECDAV